MSQDNEITAMLLRAGLDLNDEELEMMAPLFKAYTETLRRLQKVPLKAQESALLFRPLEGSG